MFFLGSWNSTFRQVAYRYDGVRRLNTDSWRCQDDATNKNIYLRIKHSLKQIKTAIKYTRYTYKHAADVEMNARFHVNGWNG